MPVALRKTRRPPPAALLDIAARGPARPATRPAPPRQDRASLDTMPSAMPPRTAPPAAIGTALALALGLAIVVNGAAAYIRL